MTQKKYLITGGAGFIGSNLAFELQNQGHSVTIVTFRPAILKIL